MYILWLMKFSLQNFKYATSLYQWVLLIPTQSEHGKFLKNLCLPEEDKIYITKVYKDHALLTCWLILWHFTGQTFTTWLGPNVDKVSRFYISLFDDLDSAGGQPQPLHHVTDTDGAVWGAKHALDAVKPAGRVVPALLPGAWKKR